MVTIKEAKAIVARMNAAQELTAFYEREALAEELEAINVQLGDWCGEGTPRADLAEIDHTLGPDYICALENGSILAWGRDRAIGRELIIVNEPLEAA